jgi:hypothetical protein
MSFARTAIRWLMMFTNLDMQYHLLQNGVKFHAFNIAPDLLDVLFV